MGTTCCSAEKNACIVTKEDCVSEEQAAQAQAEADKAAAEQAVARTSSSGSALVGKNSTGKKGKTLGFYVDDAGALDAGEDEEDQTAQQSMESQETSRSKRQLCRNQTFYFVNAAADEDEHIKNRPSTNMNLVKTFSEKVSVRTTSRSQVGINMVEEDPEEVNRQKDTMLAEVAKMVDQYYDILPAEMLLAEIENLIGKQRFREEIWPSELFERFGRKLDFFYDVGISCSENQNDWMEVYNGDSGRQLITGQIDEDDSTVLHYCVRCEIPASLKEVMAVANEIELMPKWNTLVTKVPEVIGRRTAHYMVLNYQISALGGLYKVDALNEIRRFSDQSGGFLVEYVTSVAPDHPSYKEPLAGYKRMQTLLKNVFVACGPDHTVLLQRGRLKLPFSVSKWVAKTIGGAAGKFIIGGLVNNSLQARRPGNAWEKLIEEDKFGLYDRLEELIWCDESEARNPSESKDGKVADYNLENFFNSRRFHRASSRHCA